MQIFQENDRSPPAQVVAAQIRTLLYKHEGCTGLRTKSEIEELFCDLGMFLFCSHILPQMVNGFATLNYGETGNRLFTVFLLKFLQL